MSLGDQDLDLFLADFGVEIKHNGVTGVGILDTPDQVFLDGQVNSTIYQITYKTSAFDKLLFNEVIEVDGVDYKIKEVTKVDDGAFSKAFLAKI